MRYKARWVVQDFEQEKNIDYNEVFALVIKLISYKAIFAFCAACDHEIKLMDIKIVFLYEYIDEKIYVEQSIRADDGTGCVYKLRRVLYGLKQSPQI